MKIDVIRDPVKALVFRNVFSSKINNEIYNEALKNQKLYELAKTGDAEQPKISEYRTNKVCYYDQLYMRDRSKSKLLVEIEKLFRTTMFSESIQSFGQPFFQFPMTNYHETQVSNYSRKEEHYDWHIDSMQNNQRVITVVYYFFKEPQKFTGGEIQFTNSPVVDGVLVEKNADIIAIKPENNMAVVFDSMIPHRVLPTSASSFANGRGSVNCWVGIRQ